MKPTAHFQTACHQHFRLSEDDFMRPKGDSAIWQRNWNASGAPPRQSTCKLPCESVILSSHSNYRRSIITQVRISLVTSAPRRVGPKSIEKQQWVESEEHLERSLKWEEMIKKRTRIEPWRVTAAEGKEFLMNRRQHPCSNTALLPQRQNPVSRCKDKRMEYKVIFRGNGKK